MAEQDPYEEWKAQGRPGGSFANWMASQAPPPETPPVPPPAQAQPPATPAPGGSNTQDVPISDSAANKALQNAGGAGKVGLPPNPTQAQINAWFKEAMDAGGYTERGENTSDTAYNLSGFSAAGASDVTGMRAYAKQHGMSEDFDRWSEAQLRAWEKQKDPNCPPNTPYQAYDGSGCIEKPIDSNKGGPAGEEGGGGGGKGKPAGPPPPPPKPVTFGSQLSMGTGNPLQDMLIQQFNTGQDPNTLQSNVFGLGEDFRVGGAGRNADQGNTAPTRMGQSLGGGGLWWGQDKETFSGFDASQKNAEGAATVSPAFKAAPEPKPTAVAPTIGGPVINSGAGQFQGGAGRARVVAPYNTGIMKPRTTPISGMMTNAFPPSYR